MTTTDFYNFAVNAAKERGIENPNVTAISGVYNGRVLHSCQLWHTQKRKYISGGQHGNPVAAIQAFKDALDFDAKTYSKAPEDVTL